MSNQTTTTTVAQLTNATDAQAHAIVNHFADLVRLSRVSLAIADRAAAIAHAYAVGK